MCQGDLIRPIIFINGRNNHMNKILKFLVFLGVLLIITIGFYWILWNLPKMNMSSGIPQGNCSVKGLLLDVSTFPPGAIRSSGEDFENLASDTASSTVINLVDGIRVYHAVEYYNTPFLAWQVYAYQSNIFKRTKYNDSWREPDEITFSSQTASQYRFACTHDTVVGHKCILHARYGRYFVLVSTTLSQEFTIRDLVPLLQEIDTRMSPCIDQ